jgi:SynChlorMet cassette radical SAM/SPASM protein ScmE
MTELAGVCPRGVMATPREVDIEITARCNLRCRYCYFFDNPAVSYDDLPTAEWLSFFAELGRCAVMQVTLAGGEPLLRPDLGELLAGIVAARMRFALLSNGSLIDDAVATELTSTGRCDSVQISVDGASAAVHDACRGPGAFAGAVRGIQTLQRHGVPVRVRVTIHKRNLQDLEATARLLLEELGVPAFTTNAAGYLGSCRRHADELLLSVDERQQAMAVLERLERRYSGRISALAGPLAEVRHWRRMVAARAEGAPAFANGGRLTGCGCPFTQLAVRADGAIVPCSMLSHLVLGRINRDPLDVVWQRHPTLAALRARQSVPLVDSAICADCDLAPYCTGNCPALAFALTGRVDQPSPDACLRRFFADGGRLPEEVGAASGVPA